MRVGSESVAVVTGGASGIGRALAQLLVQRRARTVIIDSDPDALQSVRDAYPFIDGHLCDVANPGAVREAAAFVEQRFGRLDVLVNNAGISVSGLFEETPIEDLERALAVNFWGVVHACRSFLPLLRQTARGGGAVICNVLSDFALIALPGKSGYAASKHAARALTDALGAELQGTGIAVLGVYPGATATALIRRGRATDPDKQEAEARFVDRGMRPELVARRVLSAIERGRATTLVGRDARAIAAAVRIAPGLTRWAVRRLWRRVPFL